jgi:beta-phosphoglucomutase-like phosphatase (HAD superfamily)
VRCLAFEDSDHGARAAHEAGLRVVVVPDLKRYEFEAAYMTLPSLEEAVAHVDRWFAGGADIARTAAPAPLP